MALIHPSQAFLVATTERAHLKKNAACFVAMGTGSKRETGSAASAHAC